MVASSTPVGDLVEASLLRGRNTVVRPDEPLGRALRGTIQPAATRGGVSSLNISLCRTASELARTLSQGTALSLGGGPLPLPLLRARQDFFESLRTTVFSVSLVVQARRVIEAAEVVETRLSDPITPPGDAASIDAFVAQFGDSFVSSLQLGGEVQGVYTFFAQSRQEARKVEQAFGGALAVSGLTLGPELSRRAAEVASSTGVNTSFRCIVRGVRVLPELSTPGQLVDFAGRFASLTLDDPQVLELETRGYEVVPELRQLFRPVAKNRILFSGDPFSPGLLRREQRLREIGNQCAWVEATYDRYGVTPDPSLAPNRARIEAVLRSLTELKRLYFHSPSTPLSAPETLSLLTGSPRLNVKVVDGEPMGGDGGEPFGFADRASAVSSRKRLVGVGLRGRARIDQIRLTYERGSSAFTPPETWQEVHGGSGGRDLGDLQLAAGVSIAKIEADTGRPHGRVDRLSLTTTDGQSIGGGGHAGNTEMHWERAPNEVVLGFSGRAKAELDALRAVIARFGPLVWEEVDEGEDP